MSKIVFCNNDIKKIKYSGYTITKAYACGGELVYSADTTPDCSDPMPNDLWKVKFDYENGDTAYILKGNNTSALTSDYANYVARYCDGQVIYNYESYYRDINNIVKATFNTNTTYIGKGFLSGSTSLEDVYIQNCNSPTVIDTGAFKSCSELKEVLLCNTITTITSEAFRYCTSLKSITIPSSVVSIGMYAFANTGLINIVMLPKTPPTAGYYMFENDTALTSICVPASAVETYKQAPRWSDYSSLIKTC